jgi:hypothetical protein
MKTAGTYMIKQKQKQNSRGTPSTNSGSHRQLRNCKMKSISPLNSTRNWDNLFASDKRTLRDRIALTERCKGKKTTSNDRPIPWSKWSLSKNPEIMHVECMWYPSDYYQMMVVRSLLPTKNKRHKSWGTKHLCVADAYPRELSIHIWPISGPKCYLMLDFWSSEVSDPKTRDRLCSSAQCALPPKPSSRRKPWFESQPKHNLDQATCQSWRGNMGVGDCPILRSIP